MKMFSWLWAFVPAPARIWVIIALIALWLGSYVVVFYKGAAWKEQNMEAKTIVKTITIREKQNEIRDNRPSVQRTADRMRNNTY
jgi:hypothetical protein